MQDTEALRTKEYLGCGALPRDRDLLQTRDTSSGDRFSSGMNRQCRGKRSLSWRNSSSDFLRGSAALASSGLGCAGQRAGRERAGRPLLI